MTPSPRRCPGERARPAGKRAQATADRCVYDIRAHVRSSQGDVRRLAVHLEFVQSGGREEYPPRRSTSARGCGQILEQGGERRASRSLGRILRETLGAEDKKGVSSRASQPAKRQGSQMERHAWRSGASRRWSSAPMCRSGSPSPVLRAPRTWPAIRGAHSHRAEADRTPRSADDLPVLHGHGRRPPRGRRRSFHWTRPPSALTAIGKPSRTPRGRRREEAKADSRLVETRGFEPPTPCVQSRCSPSELRPHTT
jgi:hypothetical protein